MEQLRCDSLTTMDGRCLKSQGSYRNPYQLGSAPKLELPGPERWTPSAGQLIDVAKWNLLRYIPVKMRGAEDDKEETAKPFASL